MRRQLSRLVDVSGLAAAGIEQRLDGDGEDNGRTANESEEGRQFAGGTSVERLKPVFSLLIDQDAALAVLLSQEKNGSWNIPARAAEPKPNAKGEINVMDIQNSSQWGGLSALATPIRSKPRIFAELKRRSL